MMNKFNRSISNFSILFLLLTTALLHAGCFLDGRGRGVVIPATSWSADALPGLVCPNDDVSVSWDAGTTACAEGTGPDCLTFTATTAPTIPSSPFTSTERSGTSNMGNINARTTFTFDVTRDPNPGNYTWEPQSDRVNIIFSGTSENDPLQFESVCNPDGIYNTSQFRLDMNSPQFLESTGGYGDCVQIDRICNNISGSAASMPITLHSLDGSLPLTTLERGGCTDRIDLSTDLAFEVNLSPGEPVLDVRPRRCLGTITDPAPTYSLQFIFTCDTESDECL